ncbi:MAG: hypothetical protein J0L67_01065 [Cytophagales bacterium]|jgi:hypothetical protein|nr:hypothetical protein [Cytophagales bacterium]
MKNQPELWYTNPSLKIVLIFSAVWFIGNGLLVLSTTDFFKVPFFSNVSMLILLMMVMSTFQTGKLIRNYIRAQEMRNQ